jgi:DNA-binding Lrp family transcriptional regulator
VEGLVKACVLIKAVPTKMDSVINYVRGLPQVKKAYFVFGRFDVACLIEAGSPSEVAELTAKINAVEGVRSTETLMEA